MRILLCDRQVVFAESLAHLLTARGEQVVGVTHNLDAAAAALGEREADVFLLDVIFGTERRLDGLARLRRSIPRTNVVLLSGSIDDDLRARALAAGVDAIGDKRQPVAEIIDLLYRVHSGDRPRLTPRVENHFRCRRRYANDAHRLAAFLTPRERQVLSALVRGDDTTKVARSLGIATNTARCHIQSLLTKMGAHSRLEVATTAVRHGMVNPQTGDWLISTS